MGVGDFDNDVQLQPQVDPNFGVDPNWPLAKPGGATKVGAGPNAIAAYSQSLRVGRAAHDRLVKLLPELTSIGVLTTQVILDGRRALRELDDALAHTKELPMLADPALETEREELKRKRDALPKEALSRISGPMPVPHGPPLPPVPPAPPPAPTRSEPPKLAFDHHDLKFPATAIGKAVTRMVTVTNLEDGDIALQDPVVPNGHFSATVHDPWILLPGESTRVEIAFSPTAVGVHSGTVYLGSGGAMARIQVEGRATAVGSSGLVAQGVPLQFDDGDAATFEVNTEGDKSVDVVSVDVVGGGGAFSARVRAGMVLPLPARANLPGVTARIEVDYDHTKQGTERTATVVVKTTDGGHLEVPVETPPARPQTAPLAFDIHPAALEFDPSEVHERRSANGTVHKFGRMAKVIWLNLRNRSLTSIPINQLGFESEKDSGFWFLNTGAWTDRHSHFELAPGQELSIPVAFKAKEIGAHTDHIVIEGYRGTKLARIPVRGDGVLEPQAVGPAELKPPQPDAKEPTSEADRQALAEARKRAIDALDLWNTSSGAMIQRSQTTLHKDWGTYLTYASANPEIPAGLMPNSGIIKDLLSNAFGNALSDGPLKFLSEAAKRKAGAEAVKNVVGAAAATLMATGAGFVVGVLIETAAGLLFNVLFDKGDEDIKKAYQEGYKDGSVNTGNAIVTKGEEIHQAGSVAIQQKDAHYARLKQLIGAGVSVAELDAAVKDLGATTAALGKASPVPDALSAPLLSMWVRGQAATTKSGNVQISNPLWKEAVKHLAKDDPYHHDLNGGLQYIPDLFVGQLATEWGRRGLAVPEALSSGFKAELGISDAHLALKNPHLSGITAHRFLSRFDRREFVWDRLPNLSVSEGLGKQMPKLFGQHNSDFDLVTSTPVLAVEDGCCVVKEVYYHVLDRKTGKHAVLRTTPGAATWASVQVDGRFTVHDGTQPDKEMFDKLPEPARREAMYQMISRLTATGTRVVQDAQGPAALGKFPDNAVNVHEQHSSGRPEPVTVYRVDGAVKKPRNGTIMPSDLRLLDVTIRHGEAIIRGGNTILVMTEDELAAIGAKSTEPEPTTAKEAIERGYK